MISGASRNVLEVTIGGRCFRLPRDERTLSVTYRHDQERPDRVALEAQMLPVRRNRYEVPGEPITMLDFSADQGAVSSAGAASDLNARVEVLVARPAFVLGEKRVALTNRIAVKVRRGATDVERRLNAAGLGVLETDGDLRICRIPIGADPVEAAAALSGADWVEYAEPDLITITPPAPRIEPAARAFDVAVPALVQPALKQIAADAAWLIQGGDAGIRVAILDDGLDYRHPALRDAVLRRYDALEDREGVASNPWDAHGTACAGLVAGRDDSQGFRGVAAGCGLFMVRVAQSPGPGQAWSTSTSAIRRGIAWAVREGADVLSCSWGVAPSASIIDAIAQGRANGRGGKGCVVVFAAGNDGGPVAFPATVSGVIAVSGVNGQDRFKTRATSDGEPWWASNQGPEVDIAAPAIGLQTTDVVGQDGKAPGDYYDRFNGTSAAAPLVAAAAALVLSHVPQLREEEVRERLTAAADKVGGAPFTAGRNDEMGFGRLNVARALRPGPAGAPAPSGVLRLLDLGPGSLTFYLERAGQAPALIATASPAALAPLVDASVVYSFRAETVTPLGVVLEDFAPLSTSPSTASTTARPPPSPAGGVRLPTPEEDVFRRPSNAR